MPFHTPLRYPGGKRRLAHAVTRLLEANKLRDIEYAEPYAGGAAVALTLLFDEWAAAIHINDLSRPVFAFWDYVLNDADDLCRRLRSVRVSMKEWHRQREVLQDMEGADLRDLGFATLFLNRTNRSGILSGGVIGGLKQHGQWKIDARFNKDELVARVRRIHRYRSRINLYQADALDFVRDMAAALGPQSFTFLDPPYIDKSEQLYLNKYDIDDHEAIAAEVKRLRRPWVVTYDHIAVQHELYAGYPRMVYGLSYSAQERYSGDEVMFLSKRLALPDEWKRRGLVPLCAREARYPMFGRLVTAG